MTRIVIVANDKDSILAVYSTDKYIEYIIVDGKSNLPLDIYESDAVITDKEFEEIRNTGEA